MIHSFDALLWSQVPNGKIWPKFFSGAKWKKYGQKISLVPNGKIRPKILFFYFLQFRVFRDLLLFHMIYDFILDTSGTKGPCPIFYV